MMFQSSLTLFFALFFSANAFSYPIFFSCDDKGGLTDSITPQELTNKLSEMAGAYQSLKTSQAKAEWIQNKCQDGKECIQELTKILEMAKQMDKVTDAYIASVVDGLKKKAEQNKVNQGSFSSLDNETFQAIEGVLNDIVTVNECQMTKNNLDSELLRASKNCILGNFNHSPYMYVSGIRESFIPGGEQDIVDPAKCDAIDNVIAGSVALGQDPYGAMAVALMERGTRVDGLYLDPIGMIGALGCAAEPATEAKHNLTSFKTYYNVKWQIKENSSFDKSVKMFLEMKNLPTPSGVSYFCSNGSEDEFDNHISEKPLSNSCCVKLNLEAKFAKSMGSDISKALTYTSLNKYFNVPLAAGVKGSDPTDYAARRVQRFNGYTHLMGGAEWVPAWRSGVDYYKTPAYGYQAMDFYLNTLMGNPYVRAKVEEAVKISGQRPKSVLCADLKPGSYMVEHDAYFNKHAQSPRMGQLYEAWKNHQKFSSLSGSQKNVLRNEFKSVKANGLYPEFSKIDNDEAAYQHYMKNIYSDRKTISQASGQDQKYNWKPMEGELFEKFLGNYKSRMSIEE